MKDTFGLVPYAIRQDYEREAAVDTHISHMGRIERQLKLVDERLSLVLAKPQAPPPLVAGCWHVHRKNDGAPDSYMPITTLKGGFREPDFGIFAELERRDLWKHAIPSGERPPDPEPDEGRIEELASDIKAAWRVPGEGGMTRRLRGRG